MAASSFPVPESPAVTVDADARPLLVADMARLRDGLLSLIEGQMVKAQLPVESIRISLKTSPEEDWEELVFRVYVNTGMERAMDFWDSIGQAISKWRPTLSKRAQKLLDEQIAVFVEWK